MFKLRFLGWRTKSALRKNKSIRASVAFSAARQIGIVFTVEDRTKHDEVKQLVKNLESEGKTVTVLEFLPKKKENYEFLYEYFTLQDLNFWGSFISAPLQKFVETPFDYLLHLDNEINPYLLHVLARSKAHCRVGRFHEDSSSFYEMMIDHKGTTGNLLDSIHSYLRKLR